MTRHNQLSQLLVAGLLFAIGCGTGTDDAPPKAAGNQQAHHESHAETFKEAVDNLASLGKSISTAFANDDADAAHGPLHDVGHLLEDVTKLSAEEEFTDEQQASIKGAVDKLFESYGAVDAMMHGNEGSSYDEVSADIDTNLQLLSSLADADSKGANDEVPE